MSGKAGKSLETLAEIKAIDERAAAELLSAARARLDGERVKLTTVQRYLMEYSVEGTGAGSHARVLLDRHRFRLQLERSVEAQSSAVERARARVEAARAHWAAVRAEREAMQKLVERREAVEARRTMQADQRQSDEQALARAMKVDVPPAV